MFQGRWVTSEGRAKGTIEHQFNKNTSMLEGSGRVSLGRVGPRFPHFTHWKGQAHVSITGCESEAQLGQVVVREELPRCEVVKKERVNLLSTKEEHSTCWMSENWQASRHQCCQLKLVVEGTTVDILCQTVIPWYPSHSGIFNKKNPRRAVTWFLWLF